MRSLAIPSLSHHCRSRDGSGSPALRGSGTIGSAPIWADAAAKARPPLSSWSSIVGSLIWRFLAPCSYRHFAKGLGLSQRRPLVGGGLRTDDTDPLAKALTQTPVRC